MASTAARRVSTGERINVHEKPGQLQKQLAARSIRLTRQRRVVLQVMDRAARHMDAGEILVRAQKIDPRITRVTVYRTLDLLKHHGLIDELDLLHLRGHRHYYESHGPRDHIHIACLRCGKVREFESELYEQLKRQIEQDCEMSITLARTEVGGYCKNCRS
ncbi:MAG TPA: Fur family transcriptional regulator [Candidatus Acidoferrales bacterium]|nr:Fur family transcriptional regulator [Candidatus Acidoferrales bacterium]